MLVRPRGRAPSARGSRHEAFLQEIRLDDVFERFGIFGEGSGDGSNAGRTAAVLLDDRAQECAVKPIETELVDAFALQRLFGDRRSDVAIRADFCEIANASQEAVRDTWRAAASPRDGSRSGGFNRYAQDARRATNDPLELSDGVVVEMVHDAEALAQRRR
jgi:hypothetical protein